MIETEEWQKDVDGMITTAVAFVHQPDMISVLGRPPQEEVVVLTRTIFHELMEDAGWVRAEKDAEEK